MLRELAHERGLPLVVTRPAIVVGAGGDPHHWGVGFWSCPEACRFYGDGRTRSRWCPSTMWPTVLARCLDAGRRGRRDVQPGLGVGRHPAGVRGGARRRAGHLIDARPHPAWRYFAADVGKWVVKCAVRHPERRLPSYRDWASRTYRPRYDCSKRGGCSGGSRCRTARSCSSEASVRPRLRGRRDGGPFRRGGPRPALPLGGGTGERSEPG